MSKIIIYFSRIISYLINKIYIEVYKIICFGYYVHIKHNKRLNYFEGMSKSLEENSKFLAGKIINLRTDADYVSFVALYSKKLLLKHMSDVGSAGIDIYLCNDFEKQWLGFCSPDNVISMIAKKTFHVNKGDKIISLYLPPFAQIDAIFIKCNNCNFLKIEECDKNDIIVYGSSVSQGCAASRPSLSYSNILSRKLNKVVKNYGFSESARGEEEVIKHIAFKHADIYILEYDHNASIMGLKNTHKKCYRIIRNNNPNSLIILMSRFSGEISISKDETMERIKIIKDTYDTAVFEGDKNIIFINGEEELHYIDINKSDLFVDDRHPNDLGMYIIASILYRRIKERGF